MRQAKGSLKEHLVEVRSSNVHGKGVFAKRAIRSGAVLGAYAGRRYTLDEVTKAEWNNALTYFFELSDGTFIDGETGGNPTRHLNHACEPNCEAYEARDEDGGLTVKFRTTRSIRAGEEIFLDYCLSIDEQDDSSDYPCHCGTRSCRGTMVGQAE